MSEEAKNKAIEIVRKFYKYARNSNHGFLISNEDPYIENAKQCALIAVEEILQDGMLENAPFMYNGKDLSKNKNLIRYKNFWQEVKNQIKSI